MGGTGYGRYITGALFVILVAGVPLVIKDAYLITVGIVIGYTAFIVIGLSLLMGYAGQVSMGQAAFSGIGAYVSAILTMKCGVNPWLAMILGALLSALMAWLLGVVVLKLEGHILAVSTLAFAIMLYTVVEKWTSVTGGTDGMPGVPALSIAGVSLTSDVHYYYLIWLFLLAILAFSMNVANSRMGRALRSIHPFAGGSQKAAESLGVPSMRYKLQIFMLSAVFASLGGSLYSHWMNLVTPSICGLHASLVPLMVVTIGGLGSLWGSIIGAAVCVIAGEGFRALIPILIPGRSGEYEIIAWGVLLILVLEFLPQGLVSIPARLRGKG